MGWDSWLRNQRPKSWLAQKNETPGVSFARNPADPLDSPIEARSRRFNLPDPRPTDS